MVFFLTALGSALLSVTGFTAGGVAAGSAAAAVQSVIGPVVAGGVFAAAQSAAATGATAAVGASAAGAGAVTVGAIVSNNRPRPNRQDSYSQSYDHRDEPSDYKAAAVAQQQVEICTLRLEVNGAHQTLVFHVGDTIDGVVHAFCSRHSLDQVQGLILRDVLRTKLRQLRSRL